MTIKIRMQLIALSLVSQFSSGSLSADEALSADAIKNLLTNNTMNCRNLEKNQEFSNYYRDNGTVTKLTAAGETQQGTWHVSEDGKHCQDWGKEAGDCCFPIIDKGNGIYQKFEDGEPRSEFTVTQGNPNNL